LLLLALPGSVYVYQGEELGLPEVADLPREVLQDPVAFRSGGREKGRDGCRVPLPWTPAGSTYGFGPGARAELPQPTWFAQYAAAAQADDPSSMLSLYRRAIALRRELIAGLPSTEPALELVDTASDAIHLRRGPGWHCVTSFGADPVSLPAGTVLLSSVPLIDGLLPSDATAWIVSDGPAGR
jgi:alpha-glucosidase